MAMHGCVDVAAGAGPGRGAGEGNVRAGPDGACIECGGERTRVGPFAWDVTGRASGRAILGFSQSPVWASRH